ncbi:uncharacterized protein LDX57_006546 [Aspergillus melleus]|uniref:uncharacterized protein n=1 Tax=Aspergillus melleus TaxID=138277 RepID=UPI001E8D7D23|nr:uncharacterized protein LDX57_006546 [Aspergillus melleus]KAH8428870.1 hypothetical protein LDX57_006546 [Aspergillus melleus]
MVPAVLQLGIVLVLPETPRWSAQAGLETNAIRSLMKVYQDHPYRERVAKQVLHDIQREIAEQEEELNIYNDAPQIRSPWMHSMTQRARDLFLTPGNRRALTIAMMLQGLQQLCGFNSLMYFSATIFSLLSFSSPTLAALSVAMTNFVFTMLAFVFIDRIGRRRILLYSIPFMIISLLACALAFPSLELPKMSDLQARTDSNIAAQAGSLLPMVVLLCFTVYTASYAFGLGNVPWQQSELFPLNVRSLGSSIATATNWGSNFVVGLTFLPMMELLSPGWTFAVYAVICIMGWFCVWSIYPELNGLSLEEVKWLLAAGWGLDKDLPRTQDTPSR